ncbi:ATP-dependent dethiobiotin synthetase BioD [Candidatus Erwinia haradaeae]|uniref:ATP-dependent dethiobiotin synthetase BioD n=1 Tax=Candidatus Erwinia haradaeae TaxID=1922217 RepID=A0A451D0U7_9GAMM|nr:dethiobiotin synthase [Candidatus Erwinia haradaeae]VFP78937.1 ATP-dependent dethiobiotin synthetase BioD [Candidatus Erwinia haradaeae]
MNQYVFVTGTDTNVGKTLASCALLQSAVSNGYRSVGYKPVSSGCVLTPHGARSKDALALIANSNVSLKYNQVNPIALFSPTSPHIACHIERKNIDISVLSKGLSDLAIISDLVVVEGVGGWLTPLGEKLDFSDWVRYERLPVVLVAGIKLGVINHSLLTASVIHQAGLRLVGWIANHPLKSVQFASEYIIDLQNRLDAPLLGVIPYLKSSEERELGHYLNFSLLRRIISSR